ncbi:hypothetical protein C9374_013445 [Naegleria lovaniensis]|uniref:Uncharacterized protein n=1 Tax=Naegleria lovaniensis TaxID=51637 RepID=A0AA88KVI4_NAELO|nr:uncharacterized protein C9374_013445 [Naegleria lovaniensis]KAG2391960.1 hypothetical protein C9374_013445 [Naegleria lovaniensis]
MKKGHSAHRLSEMSSSSASTAHTSSTTNVMGNVLGVPSDKHKYYFKFIVNALEILPEKPTYYSNQTYSSLSNKKSTTINSFFKQFSDGPKIPRTAQLEWKRNSRKRGKLPVCRYQKSIDQNKPDYYVFYTRDEKSFEFYTRLTLAAPSSSGYRDKFLRISLDQLQDDAFASSPPSKLFASKKRICEEELNLAECIQYNGVERNLILMEISQSALSNVDSSIITANKSKKKTGLFSLKLGDNSQDQEIVAYLVLRYTIVCSSSDVPQQNPTATSISTPFISNDITDDTEVSMTEQEASDSDDEEVFDESNGFKSPRSFSSSFSKSTSENNGNKTITEKDQNNISFSEKPLTSEKPRTNLSLLTKESLLDSNTSLELNLPTASNDATAQQTTNQQPTSPAIEQNADNVQNQDSSLDHKEQEVKTERNEELTSLSQPNIDKSPLTQELNTSNGDTEEGSNFFLLDEEEDTANAVVATSTKPTISSATEHVDPIQNEPREDHEVGVNMVSEIEPMTETVETSKIQNEADSSKLTTATMNGDSNQNNKEEDDFDIILSSSHPTILSGNSSIEEKDEKIPDMLLENLPSIETESQTSVNIVAPLNEASHQSSSETSTNLLAENNLNMSSQSKPALVNDNSSSFSSLEDVEKLSPQNVTYFGHDEAHVDNDDEEMFSPLHTSTVEYSQAHSFTEPKPNESLTSKIVKSCIKEEKQVEELEELRKKNSELVEQISTQNQKILDLEHYSNSFHPMVISLIWGLICSLLYSISQKEASTINPILVCAFYTIIVYFGVQLTRSLKYYNYGTHIVNYLKEAKFFNRSEPITKKQALGNYLQKLFSLEDVRFLDDVFRSASWGLLLGLLTVILKFLFLERSDTTNGETSIMTFFKSGVLYKCVYRAVADELFERLFCFLFTIFLFKEFNLKQRMFYLIDRVTNPNHKELYKSMNDFLEKNKISDTPKPNTSHRMGLPDYQSVILSAIISTMFSINDSPSQHVFTSDSFFFDKLVGSFAFSYMFFVQERIELCMIAHFCRNFIDVLFGNY